jgi:hypothetical protein
MITQRIYTGNQETILIKDDNTLNILQKFITQMTLYVPSKTSFASIYVKNALGNETISTQDLHWKKLTLHGGINTIHVNVMNIDKDSEINIQ